MNISESGAGAFWALAPRDRKRKLQLLVVFSLLEEVESPEQRQNVFFHFSFLVSSLLFASLLQQQKSDARGERDDERGQKRKLWFPGSETVFKDSQTNWTRWKDLTSKRSQFIFEQTASSRNTGRGRRGGAPEKHHLIRFDERHQKRYATVNKPTNVLPEWRTNHWFLTDSDDGCKYTMWPNSRSWSSTTIINCVRQKPVNQTFKRWNVRFTDKEMSSVTGKMKDDQPDHDDEEDEV